jgi:hypothetical protein
MAGERADLGFARELDDLDPSAWQPHQRAAKREAIRREETAAAANAAGFGHRDQRPIDPPKPGRPPTGRHVPVSLKVSEDTRLLMAATLEKVNQGQRVRIPMGEILHRAFLSYAREIGLQLPDDQP